MKQNFQISWSSNILEKNMVIDPLPSLLDLGCLQKK